VETAAQAVLDARVQHPTATLADLYDPLTMPLALTCDLPAHGLKRGDVGTAVLVHGNGSAFEVEFVGYDGRTVALVTLEQDQVRQLQAGDIPHVRELAAA